jgi:dienelactone hydrolase
MWFGSVVDRWDEEAASIDDAHKRDEVFELGATLAFPDLPETADAEIMGEVARAKSRNTHAFYAAHGRPSSPIACNDGWLTFESEIETEDAANNLAGAFILEGGRSEAVLLIPHWNAPQEPYLKLAARMHRLGYAASVLTLPYHHQRRRAEGNIADYFVSANLGRTIRAVRQAVSDARRIVDWLEGRGYRRIHVIGASLGSCIAGLVGAVDARICSTILLLTAGQFADVVWTGRATRHIATALRGAVTLDQLRQIWSIISLEPIIDLYSRPDHRLLIVSARRDKVVLPRLTADFVAKLRAAGAPASHTSLPCGHYSIGMLPFSLIATARILWFMRQASAGG